MKKLYKKGKVHPTPPTISDHLAFLPATILAMTAALSAEDREVLAYLIFCSGAPWGFSGARKTTSSASNPSSSNGSSADHQPLFQCDCFRCYTSYWVRWDASPNRKLIHDVIDAFEEELSKTGSQKGKNKAKKEKKMKMKMVKGSGCDESDELKRTNVSIYGVDEESSCSTSTVNGVAHDDDAETINADHVEAHVGDDDDDDGGGVEEERGSVRRFVSFIGEKIWGVWG